jgi:hypothetical protein
MDDNAIHIRHYGEVGVLHLMECQQEWQASLQPYPTNDNLRS